MASDPRQPRDLSPLPPLFCVALWPLGLLYGLAVRLRGLLYRLGVLKVRRLGAPVVSVGNLLAGGGGKTPMVEFLARQTAGLGLRPAVLSRGYGRVGRSGLIRLRGAEPSRADPLAVGDEPFWLAMRNPELPIYIARQRYRAGRLAEATEPPDLFLLDDGYQHRGLARELNLLLVDAERGLGNGRMLPCGYLREPRSAVRRADAVIVTKSGLGDPGRTTAELDGLLRPDVPVFRFGYRPCRLSRLDGGAELPLEALNGLTVSLLCAIAHPAGFAAAVEGLGATAAEIVVRPDHDPYGGRALAELERLLGESGADGGGSDPEDRGRPRWITTEKDAVKLRGRLSAAERLWVLEMEVVPDPGWDEFFQGFLRRVGLTGE